MTNAKKERKGKLKVTKEGRAGIYIPERDDLKEFVRSRKLGKIHNFIPSGGLFLGADHPVKGVMKDIDNAVRLAVLTEESGSMNMGHALSLILKDERGERLEVYDIGEITEDDLLILPAQKPKKSPTRKRI